MEKNVALDNMERKAGLLLIKPDSLQDNQVMKYEILHYLKKNGCDYRRMRYVVLTNEFLSEHYADIKENRVEIFNTLCDMLEGQTVLAVEVELPYTFENGDKVPMTCEQFREDVIGPTFVGAEAIAQKVKKDAKKQGLNLTDAELKLKSSEAYFIAQKTLRGRISNYDNDEETLKTLNAVHYSASKSDADAEIERVFDKDFDGKVASRIIEKDEINNILRVVKPIALTGSRTEYEMIRLRYQRFRDEMKEKGNNMPGELMTERFARAFHDHNYDNPNYIGDKVFVQYVCDLEELSENYLEYTKKSYDSKRNIG